MIYNGRTGAEDFSKCPCCDILPQNHIYYPYSYGNRLWHVSSLEDCNGYIKGQLEWAIVDDDGGICIALCKDKKDADEIAKRLNGEKE